MRARSEAWRALHTKSDKDAISIYTVSGFATCRLQAAAKQKDDYTTFYYSRVNRITSVGTGKRREKVVVLRELQ
jgi:hypothetical protein